MTDLIPDLAARQAAHAAAIQRHAGLTALVAQSAAAVSAARTDRAALIDRAAAGSEISAADIRAQDATIADVKREHELSLAVLASAERQRDMAEIAALNGQAAAIRDALSIAAGRRVAAGAALDAAIAATREALAAYDAAGAALQRVLGSAAHHDFALREIASHNAILSKMPAPEQPSSRIRTTANIGRVRIELPGPALTANWNDRPVQSGESLEARERAEWHQALAAGA